MPSSRLTKGLSDKEREDFLDYYSSARKVIQKILDILDSDIQSNIRESESPANFEKENWAGKQSYNFGYRQGIRDVIKLLQRNDHDL